jgi:hypothetical protein
LRRYNLEETPEGRFSDAATRFYTANVVLALVGPGG